MTPEQFDRWRDFSLRMARACFKKNRRPYWWQIVENVEDFFECLCEEDIVCIVDWDNSSPYPEGSPFRRALRKYRCLCGYNGLSLMDKPNPPDIDCKHCQGTGMATQYASPYCVADMCSEGSERWIPSYWSIPEDDEVPGAFELADDQWAGPVRCCLRAGLDLASAPSAGVIGFTVCDLRKMYPEGIPGWINAGFQAEGEPVDLNVGECNVPIWL